MSLLDITYNNDLIKFLQDGKVKEFNKFRNENPDLKIDLSYADLARANLKDANLKDANLYAAKLMCANLNHANLSGAKLHHANLIGASLTGTWMHGAVFINAIFDKEQIAMLPELLGIEVKEDKQ
jgi:uncharacterized protein YjbI with pentapeptide repeats